MPFGKRRTNVFANGIKHPNAREVKVSIIFTRIGEIDTINEKFSCEATLFITWSEKVTEKNQNYQIEGSSNVNSKLFWDPQLYIDNAIGDVKEKDVKYRIGKFYDDIKQEWYLEVHMIKRIQGTFFEKLELYHFPFDVQDLSITLTSHRTLDEIIIVQDYGIPPKMTKSASLDKHIWKLYDHVNIKIHMMKNDLPLSSFDFGNEELESACSHPAITMQCRVSRKPGYFIINCLLPTLMITLCVFFTFMMDYSRYQYRFSLLFTTMLTSITFRWAIHGRVLPTISYMTFLDVYCVSSIMIVFSAMVWHAFYLVLYKRDRQLAERCDRYAMISFGIVVVAIHIMQAIWFCIAFKKRLELENLDKKAALNYLKTRMAMNSINSSSMQKEATSVSEQKLQNNQILVATSGTNNNNQPQQQQQQQQTTVVTIPTTKIQPDRSPTLQQSKNHQQTIDIDTCARKSALLMSGMTSLSTSSNGSCDGGGGGEKRLSQSSSQQPPSKPHQLVIYSKKNPTNNNRPSTTTLTTTTTSTTLQIKNQQQPTTHSHLKPGHLERSRNLESTDLEDSLSKLSPHNSDTSLNSLNQKTTATTNTTTTAATTSIFLANNRNNNTNNINYIEDTNSNTCDDKASDSYYAIGSGSVLGSGGDLVNHNNLSYQYIPLIHQSSRDS